MKNLFKFALIGVIALSATTFASCDKGGEDGGNDGSKPLYYGTWKTNAEFWYSVTISPDRIECVDYKGDGYTIDIDEWAGVENRKHGNYTTNYPAGYEMTGKYTKTGNYIMLRKDGKGPAPDPDNPIEAPTDPDSPYYTDPVSDAVVNVDVPLVF